MNYLLDLPQGSCTFPLSALAHTRSGDKGNSVNIGMFKYELRHISQYLVCSVHARWTDKVPLIYLWYGAIYMTWPGESSEFLKLHTKIPSWNFLSSVFHCRSHSPSSVIFTIYSRCFNSWSCTRLLQTFVWRVGPTNLPSVQVGWRCLNMRSGN